jgi:hypothetical protein
MYANLFSSLAAHNDGWNNKAIRLRGNDAGNAFDFAISIKTLPLREEG